MTTSPQNFRSDPLDEPWLSVCTVPDGDLSRVLGAQVKGLVHAGKFTWEDVRNIRALSARLVDGELALDYRRLELLRRMCQSWDIELRPQSISSHRPLIGPVIVAAKKVLFRLVQALFREVIEQQRDFNALCIAFLAGVAPSPPQQQVTTSKRAPLRD